MLLRRGLRGAQGCRPAVLPAWARVALAPTTVEGARIEPSQDECCPVGCKTRCCGTMACCATGALSGPYALSPALFRTVTLIPRDVAGRSGPGPEALPKPHEPSREVGRA